MVRLRTLGGIDLQDDRGRDLRPILVQPRRLALLVVIALSRPAGFQRRDRLATMFWPEHSDEKARAALSRAVYFLRHHLGDGIIISRGSEELGVDRSRFSSDADDVVAALERGDEASALDRYDGELLPAFFVSSAHEFEEWLELERSYLRRAVSQAACRLAARAETSGNVASAVRFARRAVALNPFDEPAVRQLLRALDRHGDRSGALTAFAEFTQALDAQVGASPAPDTVALADAIRASHRRAETTGPSQASMAGASSPVAEMPSRPARHARILRSLATATIAFAPLIAVSVAREWRSVDGARVDVGRFERIGATPFSSTLGAQLQKGIVAELTRSGVMHMPNAGGRSGWRIGFHDSLSPRPQSRAGTFVRGSWREDEDSVHITIRVVGRPAGQSWNMRFSGSVADSSDLLHTVQRRTAGAVAVFGSTFYRALLPLTRMPPTIEAWQEFVEGARLLQTDRGREAVQRFRIAVSVDSQFTWPLVHAAMWTRASETRELSDTVVNELRRLLPRLGKLEALLARYIFASRAHQWEECYRAIHEAAALAPAQFSYLEAVRATHLHRPRDAIAALTRRAMTASPDAQAGQSYWLILSGSYHILGDHERELTAVRSARSRSPSDASLRVQELRALAALGLTSEMTARIDSLRDLPRRDWLSPGVALTTVAAELIAHGQEASGADALSHAIEWFRQRPPVEQAMEHHRFFLGMALYQAGQLAPADSLFLLLARQNPREAEYLGYRAAIAARRGDRALATSLAIELAGRALPIPVPGEPTLLWRAAVAAIHGDRETAMRLLIQAYGPQGTEELHTNIDFKSLHDYAPFQEFIRPKG